MAVLTASVDPASVPARPPPLGEVADFKTTSPFFYLTVAISAFFIPLMYAFLAIRLYIRTRCADKWKTDDTFAVTAAVVITAFSAAILATAKRFARHLWDLSIADVQSAENQKASVAMTALHSSSLLLGKLCLLTMYYRIFGHNRVVRWQLIGTAILTLPLLACTIAQPVLIGPPAGKPWGTRNPHPGKAVIANLMVGIDNLVVDICIAYIPIPVIRGLNLSKNKKRGVMTLFATGIIAVITDIITLYFRVRFFDVVGDGLLWCYVTHNCALIESAISVILSSLPCMAKLWRVYIEPSSLFQSFRTRSFYGRSTRSDPSPSPHGIPTFVDHAFYTRPRKMQDPYSMGFSTISSQSQNSNEFAVAGVRGDGIYRTTSVEQVSIHFPDPLKVRG